MSPPSLRRYRAERLLREEFEVRRGRVLAGVRARLAARGVRLAAADLESCYAQAWHALYAALLGGQAIDNPVGWLVLVTFRRALDEHRDGLRNGRLAADLHAPGDPARLADDADLASALDRRMRLRAWLEGLRGRLDPREREAAALCYLHGFTHAEAAARMGLSEGRMRKLMEGANGRRGVAAKVGALADTIRAGAWCEEQGSLMRALAYGLLDPDGERRRLAELHRDACPACRAYVRSLRGLAAVLPPVLTPLAAAVAGGGGGAAAGAKAGAGSAAPSAATGAKTGAVGAGAKAGSGAGAALPLGGAAAGGGWTALGAPVGVKLALGCALALGVGAGCVALQDPGRSASRPGSATVRGATDRGPGGAPGARSYAGAATSSPVPRRPRSPAGTAPARGPARTSAPREFTPEQVAAPRAARTNGAREFAPG
jgi:DNA-directed RNA polymerase specialized sigma24 family protein